MNRKLQTLYDGFTDTRRAGAAAGHPPTGFEGFCRERESLAPEKSTRKARSRTVAITWVETAQVPLKINASPP